MSQQNLALLCLNCWEKLSEHHRENRKERKVNMSTRLRYTKFFVNLPFWSIASHLFFIFTQFPNSPGILLNYFFVIPQWIDLFTLFTTSYCVIWWLFRKLKRVKEVYKECKFQDVFDVILTAVIHHVFKLDLPRVELAFNDSEVHFILFVVYITVMMRFSVPISIGTPFLMSVPQWVPYNERPNIECDTEVTELKKTNELWSLFSQLKVIWSAMSIGAPISYSSRVNQ